MSFLKKIDLISPNITLYFKGLRQHKSNPSAILAIISYILILASAIYYSLQFFRKNSPKA